MKRGISKNIKKLLAKRTWENGMLLVIAYLQGKIDIYNSDYNCYWAIEYWDGMFDEMKYQGFDPCSEEGIKQYMKILSA